jgi:hypothetical protein
LAEDEGRYHTSLEQGLDVLGALLFLEPKKNSRGRDIRQTLEDPAGLLGCTLISLSRLFFHDHKTQSRAKQVMWRRTLPRSRALRAVENLVELEDSSGKLAGEPGWGGEVEKVNGPELWQLNSRVLV